MSSKGLKARAIRPVSETNHGAWGTCGSAVGETTLTLKAIATRVGLRTSKSAKAMLYQWLRQRAKPGPKRRKSIKTNHTMG
jgi:hypothetical protein